MNLPHLAPGDEALVYALAAGETERYTEELLASCQSQGKLDAVVAAASRDGWHSFRLAVFTPGTRPDFVKSIQG